MSPASPGAIASHKVRALLLGFRWVAVLLGAVLVLIGANTNGHLFPNQFGVPIVVGVLLGILLVEGILSLITTQAFANPTMRAAVVVLDIAVGFGLSVAFGVGFLLLAWAVPVVEVAYWFGDFGALMTGFITAIGCYGTPAWHAYSVKISTVTDSLTTDTARILAGGLLTALTVSVVQQMMIYLPCVIFMAWLVLMLKREEISTAAAREQARVEKDVLLEQLDDQRREMAQVFNLAAERESRITEVEEQLAETRDELESVHKELHEKKAQVQAMQQMAQKKEQQTTQVHKREVEELKAEIDQLHHLLDRVTVLVEITRELHNSVHLDEALLGVLSGALKLVRSQTGILFILDESQVPAELFPEAAAGPYQNFFSNYSFKLGEQVPGYVAQHLQHVKIDNEALQVGDVVLNSLVTYEKSALVAPLADGDRALGVLYLGRPEPGAFQDEEVEDLIEFCKHASHAIANASHYHKAVSQGIADDVTGLHNAMYFNERLKEEEKRSKRYRYPVTLMLLDVDNFTEFNETYGPDRGNQLLKELGDILRAHTRETDVIARLKSDEFGVLLVQSDKNDAIMIGERIREALAARYLARAVRGKVPVSVSLGIATMPKDCKEAVELFQRSEAAMLDAKRNGGNKSAWAS